MSQEWPTYPLGKICRVINGRAYTRPELLNDGKYRVLRVGNFFTNKQWYYSDLELDPDKYCSHGDLLYAWSASFGPRIWKGEKVIYHYHIWKMIPNSELVLKEYLYRFLEWDTELIKEEQGVGTTMIHVTKGSMEQRTVPIPPLKEQQQIVDILDKAFAAIDKAKANIQQNIENAQELFQSKLNEIFSQKGDGWEETKLGNVLKLKSGDNLTSKRMNHGSFPVYGGNGIAGYHNAHNFDPPQVIIGRVGALCGNARLITQKFWLTDNAFRVIQISNCFDNDFLTILLNFSNLRSFARQAAQPVISNSSLKAVPLSFPKSISQQVELRKKIRSLQGHISKVNAYYENKLELLKELKSSILHKAFTGELSSTKQVTH